MSLSNAWPKYRRHQQNIHIMLWCLRFYSTATLTQLHTEQWLLINKVSSQLHCIMCARTFYDPYFNRIASLLSSRVELALLQWEAQYMQWNATYVSGHARVSSVYPSDGNGCRLYSKKTALPILSLSNLLTGFSRYRHFGCLQPTIVSFRHFFRAPYLLSRANTTFNTFCPTRQGRSQVWVGRAGKNTTARVFTLQTEEMYAAFFRSLSAPSHEPWSLTVKLHRCTRRTFQISNLPKNCRKSNKVKKFYSWPEQTNQNFFNFFGTYSMFGRCWFMPPCDYSYDQICSRFCSILSYFLSFLSQLGLML